MAHLHPFGGNDDHCRCDHCQGIEWPPIPIENLEKFAKGLGPMLTAMSDYANEVATKEYSRIYAEIEAKKAK